MKHLIKYLNQYFQQGFSKNIEIFLKTPYKTLSLLTWIKKWRPIVVSFYFRYFSSISISVQETSSVRALLVYDRLNRNFVVYQVLISLYQGLSWRSDVRL